MRTITIKLNDDTSDDKVNEIVSKIKKRWDFSVIDATLERSDNNDYQITEDKSSSVQICDDFEQGQACTKGYRRSCGVSCDCKSDADF